METDTIADIHNAWIALREEAALAIFDSGSVLIAKQPEDGFMMKIHDTYPDAPPSPIYLALRRKGTKTGQLADSDFDKIGQAMAMYARKASLFAEPRDVTGIPAAGEPFAQAMHDYLNEHCFNMRVFHLLKDETVRQIVGIKNLGHLDPEGMQNILLIDDLVTQAGTKVEAVQSIREAGANVTDLLVFLDRSGGKAEVAMHEHGVRMHRIWQFDELMEFYLGKSRISRDQFEAIIDYPRRLETYIGTFDRMTS